MTSVIALLGLGACAGFYGHAECVRICDERVIAMCAGDAGWEDCEAECAGEPEATESLRSNAEARGCEDQFAAEEECVAATHGCQIANACADAHRDFRDCMSR